MEYRALPKRSAVRQAEPAQAGAAAGPHAVQLSRLADALDRSAHVRQLRAATESLVQRKASAGGLPAGLRNGIEALSGVAMDKVRVHYNSTRPAQLSAAAVAQGNEIHVASGQERYLPHEAWHLVQQAQGRVPPTAQLAGSAINDDAGLEREADMMGARAARFRSDAVPAHAMPTAANRHAGSTPPSQLKKQHAATLIADRGLSATATRDGVLLYVNDTANLVQNRRALLQAWNKGLKSPHRIGNDEITADDLKPGKAAMEDVDDFTGWNSEDDDQIDIGEEFKKRKVQVISIARGGGTTRTGVPVVSLTDAIRLGRQIVKRDAYADFLPFATQIGGHFIEYMNPGTKDIYATPLRETGGGGSYRREGTSSDYNFTNLATNLRNDLSVDPAENVGIGRGGGGVGDSDGEDVLSHEKPKLKRTASEMEDTATRDSLGRVFGAFHGKTSEVGKSEAEAIAAIGSDFMKGHAAINFTQQALHHVGNAGGRLTFSQMFTGGSPLYGPAATRGRGLVVSLTQAEHDAATLLHVNNCLINAIARAGLHRNADLAELVEIRMALGNLGQMMIANDHTIDVIRAALGLDRTVIVRYGGHVAEEEFPGANDDPLVVYRIGEHFQHDLPEGWVDIPVHGGSPGSHDGIE